MSATTYRARRDRRIAAGKCTKCGRRPPAPGIKFCADCRERDLARRKPDYPNRKRGPARGPALRVVEPKPEPGAKRMIVRAVLYKVDSNTGERRRVGGFDSEARAKDFAKMIGGPGFEVESVSDE